MKQCLIGYGNFSPLLPLTACMSHPWKMRDNIPILRAKKQAGNSPRDCYTLAISVRNAYFTPLPPTSPGVILPGSTPLLRLHLKFFISSFCVPSASYFFPIFFILPYDGFIFNMLLFVVLRLACPCLFSVFFSLPGHELHPLKTACSLQMLPFLSCFITELFEGLQIDCLPLSFWHHLHIRFYPFRYWW